MRPVPPEVQARYLAHLGQKSIPSSIHFHCIKWLRNYLDFCQKYHFPQAQASSLAPFLQKLQDKKQAPPQQQQARHAISLYYELLQLQHQESLVGSPQGRITTENHGAGTLPRAVSAVAEVPTSIASNSTERLR
ncbi:MAG: phage integrase N-terminal SAM-like domain-containing protein [Syntrophobacteraceae bacterium]